MKSKSPNWMQASYGAVAKKTFRAAVANLFVKELPAIGDLSRAALAEKIEEIAHAHFPATGHMRAGQTLWPAVDENETCGYGKSIEKTALKPVILDMVTFNDIQSLLRGDRKKEIRKTIAVRLFKQAKNQGGVLTEADAAVMLRLNPSTISRYVREHEKQTLEIVPRRGTVHDMGPSVTHKRTICKKVVVEGKSISATARETNHSPEAITRYVTDYKRICTCLKEGLSLTDTSFVTGKSKSLVKQYLDLFEDFGDDDFDLY